MFVGLLLSEDLVIGAVSGGTIGCGRRVHGFRRVEMVDVRERKVYCGKEDQRMSLNVFASGSLKSGQFPDVHRGRVHKRRGVGS